MKKKKAKKNKEATRSTVIGFSIDGEAGRIQIRIKPKPEINRPIDMAIEPFDINLALRIIEEHELLGARIIMPWGGNREVRIWSRNRGQKS